jgi:hypothetical protein
MIDSNNQLKKLSKDLIDAVRGVMEGTAPKSDKEKDLAAKAPPHDKVTHADVLVGRGVLKKHHKSGKLVTKEETSGLDIARNVLSKMRNEEAEAIDEISAGLATRYMDKAQSTRANDKARSQMPMKKRDNRMAGANLAREKIRAGQNKDSMARVGTNEETESFNEALDAAARYGQHHVAIKELMK